MERLARAASGSRRATFQLAPCHPSQFQGASIQSRRCARAAASRGPRQLGGDARGEGRWHSTVTQFGGTVDQWLAPRYAAITRMNGHAWMLHEVDGMGCWQLPALRELSVCQPRSSAVAVRYR